MVPRLSRVSSILLLTGVLTGCAEQFHVRPYTGSTEGWSRWTEPPPKIEIHWHRVGYFALQGICKSGYSPLTFGQGGVGPAPSIFGTSSPPVIVPAAGCAFVDPQKKWCVIFTGEWVTETLVGHEILHCFLGKTHAH